MPSERTIEAYRQWWLFLVATENEEQTEAVEEEWVEKFEALIEAARKEGFDPPEDDDPDTVTSWAEEQGLPSEF